MAGEKITLGIWDGHDSGAALAVDNRVLFAVNEERLTRRKLEIAFPRLSIEACLDFAHLKPADIDKVALSTTDFAKTLTRVFPRLKEDYYQIRRRKRYPGPLTAIKKAAKYRITEWPGSALTRSITRSSTRKNLSELGLAVAQISLIDHHAAHVASAVFCSGFEECLGLTIDGIGDGLSGSLWRFAGGRLERLSTIDGRHSFGIFFEHVTNLLNMRELEDEGKVMALANYACPVPDEKNPMLSFVDVDGTTVRMRYTGSRLFAELKRILWHFPPEQFAFMAQRTLEVKVLELVRNALRATSLRRIAYAGGVASNVKINMLIREVPELEDLFVFPHMGDGGLALGAALFENNREAPRPAEALKDVFLGPEYSESAIDEVLREFPELNVRRASDPAHEAARYLANGEILMWFQGRMELGPRALGARSILARPDSRELKDLLNLKLKRRVWYQPFCPTMLRSDAYEILENYAGKCEPFMTCAYNTKRDKRKLIEGVINVDGSCRPQIIDDDPGQPYARLLTRFKELTGIGVILNTSFNLHGEPVVCSPRDALRTFVQTDVNLLVMKDLVISKGRFDSGR